MNTQLPPDGGIHEDPVERLRAADPAAGIEVDVAAIEAAVHARIADGGAADREGDTDGGRSADATHSADHDDSADHGDSADHDGRDTDATVTELDPTRRQRRPARWLQIAATVAGVALVGSGAFALGRQTGTPSSTSKAAPAISLVGPEVAAGSAQRDTVGSAMSSPSFAPYGVARTVFSSDGLSAAAGAAQAWTYDSAAAFTRDRAAAVAKALGLAGTPTLVSGAWIVGATDGTGPRLQLQPDATVDVSYYDPTNDPYACVDGSVKGATSGSGAAGMPVAPTPADDPERCAGSSAGPAPSAAEATARTRDLIAAAGLDPSAFEYEASATGSSTIAAVTAWAVVDGQRTGQAWNLSLTARGVQSLWGQLAPVVPLGSYPVVSPQEAVTRLGDARFGGGQTGVYTAIGLEGTATDRASSGSAVGGAAATAPQPLVIAPGDTGTGVTPTLPPVPAAGAPVSWPVQHVTLTQARLGLSAVQQPDGSVVLAPAYELSDGSGRTWSVIAVAESALDLTPAG